MDYLEDFSFMGYSAAEAFKALHSYKPSLRTLIASSMRLAANSLATGTKIADNALQSAQSIVNQYLCSAEGLASGRLARKLIAKVSTPAATALLGQIVEKSGYIAALTLLGIIYQLWRYSSTLVCRDSAHINNLKQCCVSRKLRRTKQKLRLTKRHNGLAEEVGTTTGLEMQRPLPTLTITDFPESQLSSEDHHACKSSASEEHQSHRLNKIFRAHNEVVLGKRRKNNI